MTYKRVKPKTLNDLEDNQFATIGKSDYFMDANGEVHALKSPHKMSKAELLDIVKAIQDAMFLGSQRIEPEGAVTGAAFFDAVAEILSHAGAAPVPVGHLQQHAKLKGPKA